MASEIICTYCGTSSQPGESFCENCGGQLNAGPPQATPAPGPVLLNQRYNVLNQLGAGGFGTVYRVEDIKLANRLLAAKKLQPDVSIPDQQAIDDFRREAEMLAKLRHPNLPVIHDYFQQSGDYYLIMELISGETLEDRLQKSGQKPFPIAEVLRIGIELATVLDYLHTYTPPIIFRDLKPSNMMLTPAGQVYLIDFGIARHFKPGQKKDTNPLGSKGYAPPEQYGRGQTTPQSDIYSLGAILHQMLTGNDPSDSPFNFAPLTGHRPDLQRLLERMLSMNAQERPASAVEVKQKFQKILQELQKPAAKSGAKAKSAVPSTNKASSAPQKKPGVSPGAQPAQSSSAPQKPAPPPLRARGDLLHVYRQHSAAMRALAWSPDGDTLASAGEDRQVHVWQALSGASIFTYQQHTRTINALAWSPNSRYLASASNDYSVHIWQAASGKAFTRYQEHTHWVQALAWSSDGKLIASGDAACQVHLWDAHSGQRYRAYQGHKAPVQALTFSLDARLLASADQEGEIHLWEVASGVPRATLKGHAKAVSALAFSPDNKQLASASADRTVSLWEITSGQQIATYSAHERMVNAVAWSPTGGLLASAGKDQTVHLWDCSTRQTLFIYRGHTGGVHALAWSPDGSHLASAGAVEVHVWHAR